MRGVVGGSRGWTIVWAVLIGGRMLRRVVRDEEKVVYRSKLLAGESLVIRAEGSGSEPSAR